MFAQVKTLGRSRMTPAAKPAAVPNEGDVVEAFWPDDETWLEATVTQVSEDGSFRIVWAMDDSESDVPADYVRWPGGEQMEGEGFPFRCSQDCRTCWSRSRGFDLRETTLESDIDMEAKMRK
eukprot:symbB.v1.2.021569.t2/scaffold1869.1/size97865/3